MEIKTESEIACDWDFKETKNWISLNDLEEILSIAKGVKFLGESEYNSGALRMIQLIEEEIKIAKEVSR